MISPGGFLPSEIKNRIYNTIVESLAKLTETATGEKRPADAIRNLSTDAEFRREFDAALVNAVARFESEYVVIDPEMVRAVEGDSTFWQAPEIIAALKELTKRPGVFLRHSNDDILQHFSGVLPALDSQRVDRAVGFLLGCLADELWDLSALRPLYQLVFTRTTAERAADMVAELRNLRVENKQALSELVATLAGTRQLQGKEILALESGNNEAVRNNVPVPRYEFVGRRKELAEAIKILKPYPESRYHLLTVDGVGGVGKTAMGIELANHFIRENDRLVPSERFDAVIWATAKRRVLTDSSIVSKPSSLHSLFDVHRALAEVLGCPGIENAGDAERAQIIRRALTSSRALLLIDNLETVDDQAIIDFLRDLPSPTKAIVTTRHRIDGAYPMRLEGIEGQDALTLIDQELIKKGVSLTQEDIQRLAEATSGIPLAIVWCVGQLKMGRRLDETLLSLQSAAGHYAQFCFEESVQMLRSISQWAAWKLLLSLSLFGDEASREALGFVAGLRDLHDERDRGLSVLLDLSLINYDNGRFSMLSLTREYVRAELQRDLEFKAAATQRWIAWHVHLTEQASGGRLDLDASVLSTLKQEHTNIVSVIDATFRSELFDTYVKLTRGMEFFWFGVGYWHEYERYLERGRFLAPEMRDRIHFTSRLAWLAVMKEAFGLAEDLILMARKLLLDYPDDYEQMRVNDFAGQLYFVTSRFDEARECFTTSLSLARRLGDRRGQFACLKYLGELCCKAADVAGAKKYLIEAEPLAVGTGQDQWVRGLAHSFHLRGLINNCNRDWEDAERSLQTCCDYLRLWPDVRLYTRVLIALAEAKRGLGKTNEAISKLNEAGDELAKLGLQQRASEIKSLAATYEL